MRITLPGDRALSYHVNCGSRKCRPGNVSTFEDDIMFDVETST